MMAYIKKEPLCAWLEQMGVSDYVINTIKDEEHFPSADVVEDAKIREDHLRRIIDTERTRHKAYEQIVNGYSAYIAILLDKLGATKDNAITITAEEAAEALKKYETRGIPIDGGFSLYCEVIGE
jgi:hypothetical protein